MSSTRTGTTSTPASGSRAPGGTARGRYHHGDLRNALLEAGRRMSHEVGPDALTLRGVARAAGVSHAAAYNHFIDKNDLLRGLAIRAFDDLADALHAAVAADAGLEELGVVYLRFAVANPVEFRFMFRRELCMPEGEPDPLEVASRRTQAALRARLETLQREGRLGPGDLDELLLAAWSQMHGITTIVLETPAFKSIAAADAEVLARRSMRALLMGLAAAAPSH